MPGRVLDTALRSDGSPALAQVESYERIGTLRRDAEIPVDPSSDKDRIERLRSLGYIQ